MNKSPDNHHTVLLYLFKQVATLMRKHAQNLLFLLQPHCLISKQLLHVDEHLLKLVHGLVDLLHVVGSERPLKIT